MAKNLMSDVLHRSTRLDGIYRGVVEDRNDPKQAGRCRIRVHGVHTPSKLETSVDGIPTDGLVWALPIAGCFEGAISGFGFWCVPLQGAHVSVYFENGNPMEPRYFGAAPGIPEAQLLDVELDNLAKLRFVEYMSGYETSAAEAVAEIQQDVTKFDAGETLEDERFLTSGTLGKTSERHESGGKGPECVSSGRGDNGGVSYGVYQFASYNGKYGTDCPVSRFVAASSIDGFDGLTPGTNDYSASWQSTNSTIGPESFRGLQHEYIKSLYYDKACRLIKAAIGINIKARCFGLQELVWSTAVQFGATGCKDIFVKTGVGADMDDRGIINAVYREKSRVSAYFKSSSQSVQNSVRKRYMAEQRQNIALCEETPPVADEIAPQLREMTEEEAVSESTLDEETFVKRFKEDYVEQEIPAQSDIGFADPDGVYPLPHRLGEPDFHRLARGERTGTIVDFKDANLDGLDEPIENADTSTWQEPASAYAAEYPDNIVLATHAGITVELDTTDGAERIHIYHPSNSYIEIDVNGDRVDRNSRDAYKIIDNDSYRHVGANERETVETDKQKRVKRDEHDRIDRDHKEEILRDEEREIGRDVKETIGRNLRRIIENKEEREVSSSFTEKIGSTQKITVGSSKTVNVGSTTNHTSGGDHTIVAPTIHLNP